jgi:phage terminase large subunit
VGHYWVKARFIDIGAGNKEHLCVDEAGDEHTRIFLPSLVQDNPFLLAGDPNYVKRLQLLPEKEKEALLNGNWDVFDGQYFEMFRRDVHTFEPFIIPADWRRFVAFDYGQDMFACYFAALDYGERAWVYKEIYQSGLLASEAAELLQSRIDEGERIEAFFAPPDLWNRHSDTGRSTADIFAEKGIYLSRANNDRVQGWGELAEWLRVYEDEQGAKTAKLKIGTNCQNLLRTLPAIQRSDRNPNDCAKNPHELTHAPDALRYLIAGRPWAARIQQESQFDREVSSFLAFGR